MTQSDTLICKFFVPGKSQPKGSTRAWVNPRTGRAQVTADNPRSKMFEADIKTFAYAAMKTPPVEGPISIDAVFVLQRPKSSSPKRRPHPTVKPDLDKLARSLLDGMTGIVFVDDAQVCRMFVSKRYEDSEYPMPGVIVTVFGEGHDVAAKTAQPTWTFDSSPTTRPM